MRTRGRRLTKVLSRTNRWLWSGLVLFFVLVAGVNEVERVIGQAMAVPYLRGDDASKKPTAPAKRPETDEAPAIRAKRDSTGEMQLPHSPNKEPEASPPSQAVQERGPEAPPRRAIRPVPSNLNDRSPRLEPAEDWTATY